MKYLVTGGAGFIGSHLVDRLLKERHKVLVYDNFSTGKKLYLKPHFFNPNFKMIEADLLDLKTLIKSLNNIDFVFHLAGHADVKEGLKDHQIDHIQNLEITRNLLEAIYQKNIRKIAFSSTSVVYGDAEKKPTPEFYPLSPTSLYAASKVACESYLQAYAAYYNWQLFIFRFIPFIGERYTHGIVYDLTKKILANPLKLEIFSDGTPKKSFIYVLDGIEAIMTVLRKAKDLVNIYNIATNRIITVDQIVNLILEILNSKLAKKYQGGDRGWIGDDKYIHLDCTKLKALGWRPKVDVKEAFQLTINYLLSHPELLKDR